MTAFQRDRYRNCKLTNIEHFTLNDTCMHLHPTIFFVLFLRSQKYISNLLCKPFNIKNKCINCTYYHLYCRVTQITHNKLRLSRVWIKILSEYMITVTIIS